MTSGDVLGCAGFVRKEIDLLFGSAIDRIKQLERIHAEIIFGPFTAAINDYLRSDLKFEDDHVYAILTGNVQPWSYGRYLSRFPDASNTLRQTMSANPFVKLFVAAGHFRGGLTLSPITARVIAQLLAGETTDLPLDPFAP